MRTSSLAVAAGAAIAVLVPSAAQAAQVADWQMDEGSGDTVMVDSSAGGDNDGLISEVVTGVPGLAGGDAYQFDGAVSWVQVPDQPSLDPGTADITVSATVRVEGDVMLDDSYEVIRKGTTKTKGGEWKMEIKRNATNPAVGKLRCAFKGVLPGGGTSLAAKQATSDVVDGRVHTLQCKRVGSTVTAVVDGKASSATKASGSIANAEPVILGSKVAGDDVLQGVLDAVSISIG
ncbi:MAG: hypothetical protein K0Q93_844 [Nocardioidaceae bacterium]|nr:hypothetical protein [Nocardioidaceae bacterium]